ncbi:FAD/NAD(P)-binding protein, partial [Streptomyces bacillaris]
MPAAPARVCRYLRSCFQEVVDRAPEHVSVKVHRSRAVAIA